MTLHLGLWSTLIFVHGISFVVSFLLCMWISVVLKSCVEKYILSQLNILVPWLKISYSNVYGFFSIPLIYISIYMPVSHCFNYCNFVVIFEIGNISYPIVLLCSNLFWLLLLFWTSLWIWRMNISVSTKKAPVILIGIVMNV